jgi:hypothetical protein
MPPDPRNVALRLIDQLLAFTRLSKTGLARKAGVSPSTVTVHYEEDATTTPSTVTLVQLAAAAEHELAMVPIHNVEEPAPVVRPDPDLLRIAMILTLRHVPQGDRDDNALELSRIALLAYDALAQAVLEMGHPFADDASAISLGEAVIRAYKTGRRQT